ncbi:MAG: cph1 5 [Flaviaesturariibacter sp.]|nr:cph1 5 [Flaviaesturariibacter sp.]
MPAQPKLPAASAAEPGEDLFRLLLDCTDDAIAMLDPDGRIRTWNLGAHHVFGYDQAEAIGKPFTFFLPPHQSGNDDAASYLSRAIEAGKLDVEGWQKHKDGSAFFATTILTPLHDTSGALRGFSLTARDSTQQKKLEEENRTLHEKLEEKVAQRTAELAVVNKELEAFSYSVSHDLRTPLRAISGYSVMLQEDYASQLDAEANRLISVIMRNTEMMGQLIDDLLTFSRMGRLQMISENVSMERLVREVLKELPQHDPERYKVHIGALSPCKGDPGMLKQVWVNLLSNALKYSSRVESPEITIGCRENGAFLEYAVTDNGAGFDMRYANKLFGVFQRLHRTDEFEGTGLGLALVQRIVSKHGGDIRGIGETGKGAAFYFTIPRS